MDGTVGAQTNVLISPPDFRVVNVLVRGTAPLVIERFSVKAALMAKMTEGATAKNKKNRAARDFDKDANEARHISEEGWDGFSASGLRCACISACRLVGFQMTKAKLSVFVVADGLDVNEGVPLVRIYGERDSFTAHTRNATGVIDIRSRPRWKRWASVLRVKFDAGQFSASDVINLIARAGQQVGIGAGRPDSKDSAGAGWGTFEVVGSEQEKAVAKQFGIKLEA